MSMAVNWIELAQKMAQAARAGVAIERKRLQEILAERQRKQQEEDTYKQLMYNIHPFPLHLPSMHSQQWPFLSSFPFPYP